MAKYCRVLYSSCRLIPFETVFMKTLHLWIIPVSISASDCGEGKQTGRIYIYNDYDNDRNNNDNDSNE